ncbi:hypothetical protein LSCM1_07167 [Leishmania martiniquensis]|uniref:Uncharacterized protein n=1 Tax=Leishmania martiniquensis TaxID=1580590 RepID=A0A836HWU1_9TRYP|nr:hypothetical protein LSCM1_07167 [Leishmania martiniquensis]
MWAPFPIPGEQRRSSSASLTAVRDALCHRIRILGTSILEITQSAVKEVERLDDEYAEQQCRLAMSQPPRGSSSCAGKAGAKALRPSKAGSTPPTRVALQPQRRARHTYSADPGSGAPTPGHTASPRSSTPAAGGSPWCPQSGGSAKKRQQRGKQSQAPARAGEGGAPTDTAAANTSRNVSELVGGSADENGAKRARGHALQADATLMALCAAAEANFQRVFAQRVTQDQQSPRPAATRATGSDASAAFGDDNCEKGGAPCMPNDWCRGAPLYDLSNASITPQYASCISGSEVFVDGGDDGVPLCSTSSGLRVPEDDSLASRVITAGGTAPLWARALVAASELSREAEQQALHALKIPLHMEANGRAPQQREESSVSPLGTACSYYRVVYIHKLRCMREKPSSEGGAGNANLGPAWLENSDRACTLPRRQPPSLFSLGSTMYSTASEEVGEAPLTITSYVHAVYAVDRDHTEPSEAPPERESAAASLPAAASVPVEGDTELVQLELHIPPQCWRRSESPTRKAASPMATGTKPTDATYSSSGTACRPPDTATGPAASSSVSETAQNRGGSKAQLRRVTKVAALGVAADVQVAARIECIEEWQQHRHSDVEDRIRRQRRSSIVSAGWKGGYYCYTTGARGAAASGDGASAPTTFPAPLPPHAPSEAAAMDPSGRGDCSTTVDTIDGPRGIVHQPPTVQHQDPQALQPSSILPSSSLKRKATTYAVLLPAPGQPPPQSSMSVAASKAAPLKDSECGRAQARKAAELSQNGLARSALAEPMASVAVAGGERGGAATAAASAAFPKCRLHPCLEVVVASSYSSIEWAFGGAARRASAAAPDSAPSESLFFSASPLWAAHEKLEQEWEEKRRLNARTRQPHGLDIQAPLSIRVAARVW